MRDVIWILQRLLSGVCLAAVFRFVYLMLLLHAEWQRVVWEAPSCRKLRHHIRFFVFKRRSSRLLCNFFFFTKLQGVLFSPTNILTQHFQDLKPHKVLLVFAVGIDALNPYLRYWMFFLSKPLTKKNNAKLLFCPMLPDIRKKHCFVWRFPVYVTLCFS